MLPLLVGVLLHAAPIKVAVPGFTVSGLDAPQSEAWVDRFVTLLSADRAFAFTTSRDIAAVLGIERQRQLLGCSDSAASCLAELAGALGVDAILSGTIARSGASITVTLRALKASDGAQLAAVTTRVKDVEALQDWLDAQAAEIDRQLRAGFGLLPAAPAAAVSGGSGAKVVRWVPGILGVALGVTGGVLFGLSKGDASRLRNENLSSDQINRLAGEGRAFETVGLVSMAVAGVALVASIVWVLVTSGSSEPGPGSAAVASAGGDR
ncbi:MAG: hypothetical protein IPJ65_37505 [Archangiaceae bacterium]|nr:hypothetical protein [Archangiaceae bacterium]